MMKTTSLESVGEEETQQPSLIVENCHLEGRLTVLRWKAKSGGHSMKIELYSFRAGQNEKGHLLDSKLPITGMYLYCV